jgi:hypothetical protein
MSKPRKKRPLRHCPHSTKHTTWEGCLSACSPLAVLAECELVPLTEEERAACDQRAADAAKKTGGWRWG